MPIYEYQCGSCQKRFDKIQKISDPVLTDCPECGESMLKKLVSAPSFRLAGGGWYETDFKSDKDKRRNLAAKDSVATETKTAPTEKPAAAQKPDTSS